ncbi:MAG TPA: spore coat U domain-containing protein [Kofleriaceae bacterium]
MVLGNAELASAGTATSNLNVSATVTSTCSISAGALAFGTYNPITGTQVDGTATVAVQCTKGTASVVTLGQGQNAGTGSTDIMPVRQMAAGLNRLGYSLYTDTNRTVAWGNTALTGQAYVAAASTSTNLTVYGRITANQDVPAGSFTDVVVATITF